MKYFVFEIYFFPLLFEMPVSDIIKEIFDCFFHTLEYRTLSSGENQVDAIGKLDRLNSVNTSLAKVNRKR